MEVNEAMERLGYMKRWQVMVLSIVFFMLVPTVVVNKNNFLFVGYIPKHHCKTPDNSSIKNWIPKDENGNYESCSIYVNSSVSNETVSCTDGWEYEDENWGLTIVNEWDLVCDKAFYPGFAQTMCTLGELLGFFFTGLADIFGRKQVSILFLFMISLTGVLNSFASSYITFVLGNIFFGFFIVTSGTYSIYLSETTSHFNRDFVVSISFLCWGVYGICSVIVFYFLRNWRYFMLFNNLYGLAMVPFLIFFLPETVYWLHANNKIKEAEDILIKAAKLNNVQFTRPILIPPQNNDDSEEDKKYFEERSFSEKTKRKLKTIFKKASSSKSSLKTQYSIKELYRNKYLLRHMLYGVFLSFSMTNTQGLSFMAPEMTKYMYVNTMLNFAVQIPCSFIGWLLAHKFSLKKSMMSCMFLTAVFTALVPVVLVVADDLVAGYSIIVLVNLAKLTGSIVWASSYSYQPTLFPTNLRSQGVGVCYVLSRVGLMAASFMPYALTVQPLGTYIFLALCALFSSLTMLILPETKDMPLPESIEDIEKIYKRGAKREDEKVLDKLKVACEDVEE